MFSCLVCLICLVTVCVCLLNIGLLSTNLFGGLKHESNTRFVMCHVVVKLLMFVDYDN